MNFCAAPSFVSVHVGNQVVHDRLEQRVWTLAQHTD